MSKKHTPTLPIRYNDSSQGIVDKNGNRILYMNPLYNHKKDANFIVKAVNNHDRLVEAL